MEALNDTKVVIAIITAATSFTVAMLTQIIKIIGDLAETRRKNKACLMAIRNEIVLNKRLAGVVEKHTRTVGIHFQDSTWTTTDTSVIYHKKIPSNEILELYADIRAFNTLSTRGESIKKDHEYKNKEKQLAVEKVEMVSIAEKISKTAENILKELTQ